MKKFTIKLDLWKWDGTVIHKCSFVDYLEWLKQSYDVEIYDHTEPGGFTYISSPHPWSIWLGPKYDQETIAHEAFHVTSNIMRSNGLTLSEDSEEAYAYTLGYLVDQIHSKLKKSKKR